MVNCVYRMLIRSDGTWGVGMFCGFERPNAEWQPGDGGGGDFYAPLVSCLLPWQQLLTVSRFVPSAAQLWLFNVQVRATHRADATASGPFNLRNADRGVSAWGSASARMWAAAEQARMALPWVGRGCLLF